jgi:hypothetical protein
MALVGSYVCGESSPTGPWATSHKMNGAAATSIAAAEPTFPEPEPTVVRTFRELRQPVRD